MLKTLDLLDANITHLLMLGMNGAFISMPILSKDSNGELCIATFAWEANRKQKNVPAPTHVLYTPLHAGTIDIVDTPDCGIPPVCTAKPMSGWTQKALARDFDEVIEDIMAEHAVPKYKYLYYLENMLPNYDECYYPLFKALNLPDCQIDLLK